MGRSWFWPSRGREATDQQLVATGAAGGSGYDPIDNDRGFVPAGSAGRRDVPSFTLRKARAYSVAAYRSNPMARAIVDTYTSFCVGDSGVTFQCTNPEVEAVVAAWWNDPRNQMGRMQELYLRDHMLMGETILELLTGQLTGVVRVSPIDPDRVTGVVLDRGNVLWPAKLLIDGDAGQESTLDIVQVDDMTGLRSGNVFFARSWRALLADRRGTPFLTPVLDALDSYDQVLSNLIDRTALARYLVWDVKVNGDQNDVDAFIKARGGTHVPRSGTVEVHNESVEWKPQTADTGSFEDTNTLGAMLTNVAGGMGLAKTWLSDPDGANRATSQSMAEPVRRRVGGVQKAWLEHMTDLAQYVVDRAVAAGRLPRTVPSLSSSGEAGEMLAADTVRITGPEIAAADSTVTAGVLLNLSTALQNMVDAKILSPEAAELAARKGWESYVGQPFRPDLAIMTAGADDLADEADKAETSTPVDSNLAAAQLFKTQMEGAAAGVRAGYDPDATAAAAGLPRIPHSGNIPITVKAPDA